MFAQVVKKYVAAKTTRDALLSTEKTYGMFADVSYLPSCFVCVFLIYYRELRCLLTATTAVFLRQLEPPPKKRAPETRASLPLHSLAGAAAGGAPSNLAT